MDDHSNDDANNNANDAMSGAAGDEQEITLTFSYEPHATLEELFGLPEETLFHAFDLALERVGVRESVEVSVLITTDEGIRALNREYRGKDESTDVLSFPLLDQPIVDAPADQLWPSTADDLDEDGLEADDTLDDDDLANLDGATDAAVDEEFANAFGDTENDADQSLKGMVVILGDEGAEDDAFDDDSIFWPTHLGDIAISRETAVRQAQQAGHSAAYEVAFLFVHGVLHLVGFDDHTDAGYQAMVAHQEAALAQAGVTRS
ncbi:MAG TPA: rRNA maturation RNase YbeY [Ktedonobacterales bacterium]|jgi:probable rRNA maturation factor|nr:rRNA maturation RNase YbeY [Ktedonobacterales bacterium]